MSWEGKRSEKVRAHVRGWVYDWVGDEYGRGTTIGGLVRTENC